MEFNQRSFRGFNPEGEIFLCELSDKGSNPTNYLYEHREKPSALIVCITNNCK